MKRKDKVKEKDIVAIEITETEALVFALRNRKYGPSIDVRMYVDLDGDGKKVPVKQGWSLPVSKGEELREAVEEVLEVISKTDFKTEGDKA